MSFIILRILYVSFFFLFRVPEMFVLCLNMDVRMFVFFIFDTRVLQRMPACAHCECVRSCVRGCVCMQAYM